MNYFYLQHPFHGEFMVSYSSQFLQILLSSELESVYNLADV